MSQDYYRDCWLYNGQVRTVTRTAEDGMHVRGWGDGHLAWRGHQDDLAYLDGDCVNFDDKVKGNFPCAFHPFSGIVHVQHSGGGDRLDRYALDGQYAGSVSAPYASEGIHHIEPDGRIVMGNADELRRLINGELWHNCVETENYIVGQYGRDPDYGGALARLHKPTGHVRRWLGYTPHPPRAVELDGILTVAISGRDTPEPSEVIWSGSFPPLPVTPDPVVPVPVHPRPMIRGGFGDNIPGSNVGSSGHALAVIDGPDYITEQDKPKLKGIIFDPFYTTDQARIERDRQKAIALCKETGAACCVFDDGHDIGTICEQLDMAGVAVVHLKQSYPTSSWINNEFYAPSRPTLLVRALYTAWPDHQIAENQRTVDLMLELRPWFLGELAFGWSRSAPQAPKPWIKDYWLTRCQQTPAPDWLGWPKTRVVGPVPAPPKPQKPEPARSVGAWVALFRALARLFKGAQ
jgi:hypothetical protein